MNAAIATLARREAIKTAKAALRRQGRKPQQMAHREIVALAEVILATRRAELLAEARQRVERWLAEVHASATIG